MKKRVKTGPGDKITKEKWLFAAAMMLTAAVLADCFVHLYRDSGESHDVTVIAATDKAVNIEPLEPAEAPIDHISADDYDDIGLHENEMTPVPQRIAKREHEAVVSHEEPVKRPETASELSEMLRDAIRKDRKTLICYLGEKLIALGDLAVPFLANVINSSEPKVASEAYRILSRIDTVEAKLSAVNMLMMNDDLKLEKEFSRHLSSVCDPAMTEVLAKMMGSAVDSQMKDKIGRTLSVMEGDAVVNSLARLSASSTDESDTMEYAAALADLNKPSNAAALANIMKTSSDPLVKQAAALGIANIGNREALDMLVISAEEDSANSRTYADALTTVSSPYGQSTLFEIVRFHPNPDLRASASAALSNYKSSDVKRELQQIYHAETDTGVKDAIAESIDVIDHITRPLNPSDPDADELVELTYDIT